MMQATELDIRKDSDEYRATGGYLLYRRREIVQAWCNEVCKDTWTWATVYQAITFYKNLIDEWAE